MQSKFVFGPTRATERKLAGETQGFFGPEHGSSKLPVAVCLVDGGGTRVNSFFAHRLANFLVFFVALNGRCVGAAQDEG